MPNRFYILGCQRTGTTLLRLILDSHPSVHCYDESQAYEAFYQDTFAVPKPVIGFKLPCWTEVFAAYDCIRRRYRGEPILFMLRDVRGAVASMLKLWPENELISGYLADSARDFSARFGAIIHQAEVNPHRQVIEHAAYWMYKTEAYFELVDQGFNVLPVHYEKLVAAPRPELQRVIAFLGLAWDERLLLHDELPHDETSDGLAMGNTLVHRPIDADSTNLWTSQLTREEQQAILDAAGVLNETVSRIEAAGYPR